MNIHVKMILIFKSEYLSLRSIFHDPRDFVVEHYITDIIFYVWIINEKS